MLLEFDELSRIADVNIDSFGLSAKLKLQSGSKIEATFSIKDLKRILEVNNVTYGINNDLLEKICASPESYRNLEVVIATGKAPINGEDAYINWAINKNEEKKPIELNDGTVDFYSINRISNVTKGQLIAEKIPTTKGEPGISVSGADISPRNGKDIVLKQGKNVLLSEDKCRVYAAIDGQFEITDKDKLNVFPIYEVTGDLDFSIGNINFVGTVVIRGNVPDGFKVHADGDIKVYGNVEGAELIAGGDIFVQQGVIGHNKSLIKAKGNFQAGFILDGNVSAGGNIQVTQSIMHSQVSAGKQVICKGVKGIIVGGKVQAGETVIASVIGNQMATATSIEVGIRPELRVELNEIHNNVEKLDDSLDKVKKGLNILEQILRAQKELPPDKKQMQINLINQQLALEKEIKTAKLREKEIEEQLTSFEKANIQVHKIVYPGTKLIIGKDIKHIKVETQYSKFVLDEGMIISRQI